ncbi:Transcriptional regulator, MarR family [uncultured Pleomorphomonas sp.]|uniref:Transcriptional regulator, MarR family n=1 Tax=uncultured Pleomorphomonas sp. TaxID=442121 RepID=A0A212LLB6_9HYPH|nr:MarR family transcriptional regulator [uncultured Pleomorphomonas sp.]SCM78333.1 Transcriptional regulator, MarR family [uncultured Pleomorphomonas sp.]
MPLPDDLANCLVLNTVAAARALVRRYDAKLKPFGVTVQQFSLLAAIRYNPGATAAALSSRIHLDRTSLIRNLDRLELKGLARRVDGSGGNMRVSQLTDEGDVLLDRLLVEWQAAQAGLMRGSSPEETAAYLKISRRFSR